MTPEEHAAEAERIYGSSEWINDPIATVEALGALVHAVLSLRPQPFAIPIVTDLPALRGAVVRATIDGQRRLCCRLPEAGDDSYPWMCDSGMCFADDDLRDVEVLYPGVPS